MLRAALIVPLLLVPACVSDRSGDLPTGAGSATDAAQSERVEPSPRDGPALAGGSMPGPAADDTNSDAAGANESAAEVLPPSPANAAGDAGADVAPPTEVAAPHADPGSAAADGDPTAGASAAGAAAGAETGAQKGGVPGAADAQSTDSAPVAAGAAPAAGRALPAAQDDARPRLPEQGPLRVAPDGSGHYATLTDAMLGAPAGRELRVAPGVYKEALSVDRKLLLVADGGAVVVDGGAQPAIALDAIAQVTLRGFTLLSGTAAASVGRGQLVLEECELVARPKGVALRTTDARSQLVVRRCLVDAADGTAMQLHPASHGDLSDTAFAWSLDNDDPLLTRGAAPSFTVVRCGFGWRRHEAPILLPEVAAVPMPADGRLPLRVDSDRSTWPAWAKPGRTHFGELGAAIAAAPAGVRVDVSPGRYAESVGLRQSVHLRALGGPGSVVVTNPDGPALWFNGDTRASVTGFRLESAVGERTGVVQVNGGWLDIVDCTLANPVGHGVIATSSYADGKVVLERCDVQAGGRALYVTGVPSRAEVRDGRLASDTQAIFVDGGQVLVQGCRIEAGRVGVEVWGGEARVELQRCIVDAMPKVLQLARGASRSQVVTGDLVVEPVSADEG